MKTGIEYYYDLVAFLRQRVLPKMAVGTIMMTVAILIPFANRMPSDPLYWGEGVRPDVRRYVRIHYDGALELWDTYRIPIWGTMAMAILESGVGQSDLAVNANNHFGIKANNEWYGPLYIKVTGRSPNNEVEYEVYRLYSSVEEGYLDFGKFLQKPRYDALRRCGLYDFDRWCYALQASGYAADKNYAKKLLLRIRDYHLDDLNRLRPEPMEEV